MVLENTIQGNITDRDHCINIFNQNVRAVKDTFKGDKLFVYNIGDGWDGLYRWLDVPIPDTPRFCYLGNGKMPTDPLQTRELFNVAVQT